MWGYVSVLYLTPSGHGLSFLRYWYRCFWSCMFIGCICWWWILSYRIWNQMFQHLRMEILVGVTILLISYPTDPMIDLRLSPSWIQPKSYYHMPLDGYTPASTYASMDVSCFRFLYVTYRSFGETMISGCLEYHDKTCSFDSLSFYIRYWIPLMHTMYAR